MKKVLGFLIGFVLLTSSFASADIVSFDDLFLGTDSYWNGSDGSGSFMSGDAYFANGYNSTYGSWDGWAYSNMKDTTNPGYTNQFSAVTGSGVNGSSNYGVAYDAGSWGSASPAAIYFGFDTGNDYDTTISGAYFTNTTYAYLSMLNGDGYTTAFTDGDWQMVSIKGIDASGNYTGSIDFYLADFTNGETYILDEWLWVDLTGLGDIIGLEYSFSGSQESMVPAYLAMDDLNGTSPVPVPAAFWLLGSGIVALFGFKRRISA